MESAWQTSYDFLSRYGYPVMFPLMVVQQAATTIVASMLSSLGIFSWKLVFLLSLLGDIAGNVILYAFGYGLGIGRVKRFGKYFGTDEQTLLKMMEYFRKRGGKIIFATKTVAGLFGVALVAAGVAKMDFKKFLEYSLVSGILWSGILVAIGYFYGFLWKRIGTYFSWVGIVISLVALISFVLIKIYRKRKSVELLK